MKIHPSAAILSVLCFFFGGFSQADENETVVEISNESFQCVQDMTPVRGFFVDNLLGNLEETLSVANSADGGDYPTGSVVQLVPSEIMVKRAPGVSPETNDWEFFIMDTTTTESKILTRGFGDVVNRFGGNCLSCHEKAEPKWDMVCESTHGCDPIPLTRDILTLLQKTDLRCEDMPPLSAEDQEKLAALQQMMQAQN